MSLLSARGIVKSLTTATEMTCIQIEITLLFLVCIYVVKYGQLRKDKMWGAYHMLRTSKTFREDWSQFLLESVGHQASPAFFNM